MSWHLWRLVFIMKWILWVIRPPVESIKRDSDYLFIGTRHHSDSMKYTHMRSSTKRIFLFSPSIAFISASEREKSNICSVRNTPIAICFTWYFLFFRVTFCRIYTAVQTDGVRTNLKVLLYTSRVKALWDDHHSPLDVEPQGHLGCGLVVLFSNWCQKLVFQQWGAFKVDPVEMIGILQRHTKLLLHT